MRGAQSREAWCTLWSSLPSLCGYPAFNAFAEPFKPGAFIPFEPGRYLRFAPCLGVKVFLLNGGRINLGSLKQLRAAPVNFGSAYAVVAPVDQLDRTPAIFLCGGVFGLLQLVVRARPIRRKFLVSVDPCKDRIGAGGRGRRRQAGGLVAVLALRRIVESVQNSRDSPYLAFGERIEHTPDCDRLRQPM
jgi:hypothetical protein